MNETKITDDLVSHAAACVKKKKKKKKKVLTYQIYWVMVDYPFTKDSTKFAVTDRDMKPSFAHLDLSLTLREKNLEHSFWSSQPVLKMKESAALSNENEPIQFKTLADVGPAQELPLGFEWVEVDMLDAKENRVVYELLRDHYVSDEDQMFRFDYSVELMQWAMMPPGWKQSWHIGVRRVNSIQAQSQLVGFITAVPCHALVYGKQVKMVEINFLCVHQLYRDKRLAPALITEITRRVNLQDIWQAVYTAGVVLPHPISSCQYHYRALNPKKLIEVKFSHKHPKLTLKGTFKYYSLPMKPQTPGLRPLEKRDVPGACAMLNKFLQAYHVTVMFTKEEFEHWFLPREGIIYSWVVENPNSKHLTDMISFYHLPSTILQSDKHKTLRSVYSFYNVSVGTGWVELMQDALILAKNLDFDVFNALDVMENVKFLEALKFQPGNAKLQYYFHNWKCPATKPEGIGLVLI